VSVNTAIWDSGYQGYSNVGLIVHNEHGVYLKRGARILQMYFFRLDAAVDKTYNGRYQGESILARYKGERKEEISSACAPAGTGNHRDNRGSAYPRCQATTPTSDGRDCRSDEYEHG